jgi:hypothetical protein
MPATLQLLVATVGRARQVVGALLVVGARAAQRGIAGVDAYIQAAVGVGGTSGAGFTTCVYMERTLDRSIAAARDHAQEEQQAEGQKAKARERA